MTREIKFRVWRIHDKTMHTDQSFIHHALEHQYIDEIRENIIVMQYTGLKDKNVVEIYEGDVIKASTYQREIDVLQDNIVTVSYQDGYFYPFGYNCGRRSGVYDLEVLGNKYENPELLSHNQ